MRSGYTLPSEGDILTRLEDSRTLHTRQSQRDLWVREIPQDLDGRTLTLARIEYQAMGYEEKSALSQVLNLWLRVIHISLACKGCLFVPYVEIFSSMNIHDEIRARLCLYASHFTWTNTQDAIDRLLDIMKVIKEKMGQSSPYLRQDKSRISMLGSKHVPSIQRIQRLSRPGRLFLSQNKNKISGSGSKDIAPAQSQKNIQPVQSYQSPLAMIIRSKRREIRAQSTSSPMSLSE